MQKQKAKETERRFSKNWAYLVGLVFILGSEFTLRDIFLPKNASDIHVGIAVLVEWVVLLVLLVFWIPKIEGQNLASIGLGKFKLRYLWLGILVYLLVVLATATNSLVLKAIGLKPISSLQPMIKEYSIFVLVGLFLTGPILEEIFYRGYLIERLVMLTGRSWLAGLISWIAFTLVHIKFVGPGPTLDVGIISAGLVILYLKERSIWPCTVMHGLNSLFAYLVFPLLIA